MVFESHSYAYHHSTEFELLGHRKSGAHDAHKACVGRGAIARKATGQLTATRCMLQQMFFENLYPCPICQVDCKVAKVAEPSETYLHFPDE